MRGGTWIAFDAQAWTGANIAAESAYGIYNPVTLINMVAISMFDDLALASFVVMTEFLVIVGTGGYLLSRSYGAQRWAACLVGVVLPFAGFTLFYEAGNWASGLMAAAWTIHFWWTARDYSQGRRGPILAFITGALAISVGNPYSLLSVLVLLMAFAVELAVGRRWRRLGGLVVVGLGVGTIAVLTYAPLIASLSETLRESGAAVQNTGYLVPALSDLFSAGSPTHLPQFPAWYSAHDKVPSVYLSFAVVLLLPWLRWVRPRSLTPYVSLIVASVVFLLLTIGPEQVWLFRWPIRLIEYLYFGLAAGFAVVLSQGIKTDHLSRRVALTGVLLLYGLGSAWSVTPDRIGRHLTATAVLLGLVLLGVLAYRRVGPWGLTAVAAAGTLAVAPLQASYFAWHDQSVVREVDLGAAHDLVALRAATAGYEGTVFQVASLGRVEEAETLTSGRLAFGNTLAASGVDTVNRYTGLSFRAFSTRLCIDYRGGICREDIMERLFTDVRGFDEKLVDVMGVDTLVLDDHFLDVGLYPGAGWMLISDDEDRNVFVRETKRETVTQATGSRGVEVRGVDEEAKRTTVVTFDGGARGGRILVNRLAWSGYSATVDGAAVAHRTGPFGLVEIDVPAGQGELRLSYAVPGEAVGLVAGVVATLMAFTHQLVWWRDARRRARSSAGTRGRGVRGAHVLPADTSP